MIRPPATGDQHHPGSERRAGDARPARSRTGRTGEVGDQRDQLHQQPGRTGPGRAHDQRHGDQREDPGVDGEIAQRGAAALRYGSAGLGALEASSGGPGKIGYGHVLPLQCRCSTGPAGAVRGGEDISQNDIYSTATIRLRSSVMKERLQAGPPCQAGRAATREIRPRIVIQEAAGLGGADPRQQVDQHFDPLLGGDRGVGAHPYRS